MILVTQILETTLRKMNKKSEVILEIGKSVLIVGKEIMNLMSVRIKIRVLNILVAIRIKIV